MGICANPLKPSGVEVGAPADAKAPYSGVVVFFITAAENGELPWLARLNCTSTVPVVVKQYVPWVGRVISHPQLATVDPVQNVVKTVGLPVIDCDAVGVLVSNQKISDEPQVGALDGP